MRTAVFIALLVAGCVSSNREAYDPPLSTLRIRTASLNNASPLATDEIVTGGASA